MDGENEDEEVSEATLLELRAWLAELDEKPMMKVIGVMSIKERVVMLLVGEEEQ